ncbi:MAG: nuclear transport factor 2 family protein [Chloroflexota bacterium]|nr:nuclear transport factor 2 family protein [Chloroflexota bacterium]
MTAAPEEQVKDRILQFHQAATNGDVDLMAQLFSNGPDVQVIGSDPTELAVGHAAVVQFWTGLFQYLRDLGYPNNGGLPTVSSDTSIQVGHEGAVAWAVDFPTWQFRNGEVPFRVSLVLRREQGEWKFSQVHFSVGVPNADLPM